MNRRRRVFEGRSKVLYEGPESGTLIQHFKDDLPALKGKKPRTIDGKGVLNSRICEYLFKRLGDIGIPNHFLKRLNMREQLIQEVEIIPIAMTVETLLPVNSVSVSVLKKAQHCRARLLNIPINQAILMTRW